MDGAKVDTPQNRRQTSSLVVLTVVLESGERLPCLVDRATWIPARVAMRWAVRYRRYRVQFSTLENNLRTVGRTYAWAESVGGFDLECRAREGEARVIPSSGRVQSDNGDEKALHRQTRTVFGVYLLLHEDQWASASGSRHGTLFWRDAAVGAPDGTDAGDQ